MQPLRGTAPRLHVDREGDPRRSVSWLELFYDLIYVAALIQLRRDLLPHPGLAGAHVRAGHLRVPPARPLARRFGLVFAVGAVIWLVSAFVPAPTRYLLWGLAILVDFSRILFPGALEMVRRIPADHEHAAERYAQFTLMVLGEAFIKVIDLLSGEDVTPDAQVFAGIGFAIACALWWTYFDDVAISRVRGERLVLRAGAVWVYGHLPLTMALTAVGVGVRELALGTFSEPIPTNYLWLLVGAVAGALVTVAVLDAVTEAGMFGLDARHTGWSRVWSPRRCSSASVWSVRGCPPC